MPTGKGKCPVSLIFSEPQIKTNMILDLTPVGIDFVLRET
jgi:hypothetical protein